MQAIYDKILAAINNPNNQISVIETADETEIEISSCTKYDSPVLRLSKDTAIPFFPSYHFTISGENITPKNAKKLFNIALQKAKITKGLHALNDLDKLIEHPEPAKYFTPVE